MTRGDRILTCVLVFLLFFTTSFLLFDAVHRPPPESPAFIRTDSRGTPIGFVPLSIRTRVEDGLYFWRTLPFAHRQAGEMWLTPMGDSRPIELWQVNNESADIARLNVKVDTIGHVMYELLQQPKLRENLLEDISEADLAALEAALVDE